MYGVNNILHFIVIQYLQLAGSTRNGARVLIILRAPRVAVNQGVYKRSRSWKEDMAGVGTSTRGQLPLEAAMMQVKSAFEVKG